MRELYYGEEARARLCAGMDKLADAVCATLGPGGRNVAVEKEGGAPVSTNAGQEAMKLLELSDETENLGAKLLREAAKKVGDTTGDGTATTVVLTRALLREGRRNVSAGANPQALRKGILGAAKAATDALTALAEKAEHPDRLARVASISGSDEEIGSALAEILSSVGADGAVTVEEGNGRATEFEIVCGSSFDQGYVSNYLVTNQETGEAVLEKPYLLFTDRKLTEAAEVIPAMDLAARRKRPLLIVAENVEGEALKAVIINKTQGALSVAAVRSPGYGDRKQALVDTLALLTGATVVREAFGMRLEDVKEEFFGRAEKVVVQKDRTILTGGAGDKERIEEEANRLRRKLAEAEDEFAEDRARECLAKLAGGVGVIRVGASTETELKEKKKRTEEALAAVRAALLEGIVPGGGAAYLAVLPAVERYAKAQEGDVRTGAEIVARALPAPLWQIAENVGLDGGTCVRHVLEDKSGASLDAASGTYVDMKKAGIVDPVKVTRLALSTAASMAASILTVEADVVEPVRR